MAQVTKARLELEITDNRREIAELRAELATAVSAHDGLLRVLAQMTIWQFMVARCARQL